MIEQKTSFRIEYSDCEQSEHSNYGFFPFKNEYGEFVEKRVVEITPSKWDGGSCLIVKIIDIITRQFGYIENIIHSRIIYCDNDSVSIKPTREQHVIIDMLVYGGLRGTPANDAIMRLYLELVVLNKEFGLKKWLPIVTEKFNKG